MNMKRKEIMLLILSVASFACYFVPLAGIVVALVTVRLARTLKKQPGHSKLLSISTAIAWAGLLFCIVVQVYLLATFTVG